MPSILQIPVVWQAALLLAGSNIFMQVPANRIGYHEMSLGQLKILQEAITLAVFVPLLCSTCSSH